MTEKEEKLLIDCRKKIKELLDKSNNPDIKRRCALALTSLNIRIDLDLTYEDDEPFM